jgi:hypothetical protein
LIQVNGKKDSNDTEHNTDDEFPYNSPVVSGYLPVKFILVFSDGALKNSKKPLLINRAIRNDLQGIMGSLLKFRILAERFHVTVNPVIDPVSGRIIGIV